MFVTCATTGTDQAAAGVQDEVQATHAEPALSEGGTIASMAISLPGVRDGWWKRTGPVAARGRTMATAARIDDTTPRTVMTTATGTAV